MSKEKAKQAAAAAAVAYVEPGMVVGLGTGSTAYFAIERIGQRVVEGLEIEAVPTSRETEALARKFGIPLAEEFTHIDVTIDGADEVDPQGNLIKGGGGALTREKIVAAATEREIIIVDEGKLVERLGRFPLPVEVLPFGWRWVRERLAEMGCTAQLRRRNDEIFVTDNQNYILDCIFKNVITPEDLETEINTIPGVVENGLFVGLTDMVLVGNEQGKVTERTFAR